MTRAFPFAHIHHRRSQGEVTIVHGRSFSRMMLWSCQKPYGNRLKWRTGSRDTGFGNSLPRHTGASLNRVERTHFPLARSHGNRAVALQGFDFIKTFIHGITEIFSCNILTQANELLFAFPGPA